MFFVELFLRASGQSRSKRNSDPKRKMDLTFFALSIHTTIWLSTCKVPQIFSSNRNLLRCSGGKSQDELESLYYSEDMTQAQHMKVVPEIDPSLMLELSNTQKEHLHSRVATIIEQCPSLHKTFWTPFVFCNPHIQLIPYMIRNLIQKNMPPVKYASQRFQMEDGEELTLDWAVSHSSSANVPNAADENARLPCNVLLLHHGAYGRSNDNPGYSYISEALDRGWLVMVINRRGHRGKLTRPSWNFFGSTSDVRHIVENCVRAARPNARVVMLGVSAGSGLCARYMGEQGLAIKQLRKLQSDSAGTDTKLGWETDEAFSSQIHGYVHSVIGIVPGYNIEACMDRFGPPYSNMIFSLGNAFFLKKNKQILLEDSKGTDSYSTEVGSRCYEGAMGAKTLQIWLDNHYGFANTSFSGDKYASGKFDISSVPQINGKYVPGARSPHCYTSSDEYYDYHNPMRMVQHIIQPCLFINSEDDPLCNIVNVWESLQIFNKQEAAVGAVVVVTKTGSHCSFLQSPLTWDMSSWTEKIMGEFFDGVLKS